MLLIILLVLIIIYFKYSKKNESFGWNCTWTPNVDYYKEDWLLGNNPAALTLARDSIQGPIYN